MALILNDWIKKGTEILLRGFYAPLKRLGVFLKRQGVILVHHVFHHLPTKSHNDPLFECLDGHCDAIFVNVQALELPEEPEVFDF